MGMIAQSMTVFRNDLALRGGEEYQHREFFGDVVEAVLDILGYEENIAGSDFAVFVTGAEAGAAAHHVVHLIFLMRALQVGGAGCEYVEPGTHRRHAEKLAVQLAALRTLPIDLGDACEERLHGRMPL